MRRLLALVAGALFAVGAWALPAGADDAATITDVGWWTSSPAATAPNGGVAVQAAAGGSSISVAAVRISVRATSLDKAVLILKEAGGVQASGAQLQVCPTSTAWVAVAKGDMAKAPRPECDRKVALVRNADIGSWSADVRSLLSSASPSLMIVPAGAGAVPLGFEVQFERPTLDAQASPSSSTTASSSSFGDSTSTDEFAATSPSSSSSSSSSFSSSADTSSFAPSYTPRPSVSSTFSSGTSAYATPSVVTGTASPAPQSAPAEVAAPAVATPAAATPIRARTAAAPVGRGNRGLQALFFIALAGIAGVATGVSHARFRGQDPSAA